MDKKVSYISVPARLVILPGILVGLIVGDVILTDDELEGLMTERLTSAQEPNGPTRISDWLIENQQTIGSNYSSELDRHWRWSAKS